MQTTSATRPVMDVSRRPAQPVPGRAVRAAVKPLAPAPVVTTSQPAEQPHKAAADVKTEKAPVQEQHVPEVTTSKSTAPVGVIVTALLVMMILIGLAVIIYLTSSS